MFFQPMSDFYTFAMMGLLAHSWFEIMEFSQSFIIRRAYMHGSRVLYFKILYVRQSVSL